MNTFELLVGRDFPKRMVELFDSAKHAIDVVVYDWRWYPNQPGHAVQQFNNALVSAVNRGVKVRAVVNRDDQVPVLQSVGIKARRLRDRRVVHSKMIMIDQSLLVIGSHNFTRNAFGSNIETSLLVSIPANASRHIVFFENLYLL